LFLVFWSGENLSIFCLFLFFLSFTIILFHKLLFGKSSSESLVLWEKVCVVGGEKSCIVSVGVDIGLDDFGDSLIWNFSSSGVNSNCFCSSLLESGQTLSLIPLASSSSLFAFHSSRSLASQPSYLHPILSNQMLNS